MVVILLVTLVGIVFGVLSVLSFLVVRRSRKDPFVQGADHTTLANCLGLDGLDRTLLGTGTLALFPNEIRFVIATPRRQLTIPRGRLSVTLEQYPDPGDYRPGDDPALVLRWKDNSKRVTIGFKVPDPDTWKSLLLR